MDRPTRGTTPRRRWASTSPAATTEARAAYEWLRRSQNPDGSWYRATTGPLWPMRPGRRTSPPTWRSGCCTTSADRGHRLPGPDVAHPGRRARFHPRAAGARRRDPLGPRDRRPAGRRGPADRLRQHVPQPAVRARAGPGPRARPSRTGNSPRPRWATRVVAHPERFAPRDRYSMDWYYPILGGALRGDAARARIEAGWDVRGARARAALRQRPAWVTGAETCELVLALCALGEHDRGGRTVRRHAAPARRGRLVLDRVRLPRRRPVARGAHHLDRRRGAARRGRAAGERRPPRCSARRDCRSARPEIPDCRGECADLRAA